MQPFVIRYKCESGMRPDAGPPAVQRTEDRHEWETKGDAAATSGLVDPVHKQQEGVGFAWLKPRHCRARG